VLTSLTLRNFKCFESAEIPFGRITVLIGENGTGKSSVLHALALMRQSLGESELRYSGDLLDLSSYQDVVSMGKTWKGMQLEYNSHVRIGGGLFSYAYGISSGESLGKLSLKIRSGYPVDEIEWTRRGPDKIQIEFQTSTANLFVQPIVGRHASIMSISGGDSDSMLIDLARIITTPSDEILTWRYTPVSRGFTRSSYDLSDDMMQELLGGASRDAMDASLASAIAYDSEVGDQISEWLNALTNIRISSGLIPGRRAQVRSVKDGVRIRPAIINEGFGSNQLIAMLYQLAKTPSGGLQRLD
jgi:energy-coupling factor transporter ATP-binding protein EcfA2